MKLLARDTWTVDAELKGGHSSPVSVCSYCPNGRYLATADANKMVVWDVESKEELGMLELPSACTSIR